LFLFEKLGVEKQKQKTVGTRSCYWISHVNPISVAAVLVGFAAVSLYLVWTAMYGFYRTAGPSGIYGRWFLPNVRYQAAQSRLGMA
jgi:hypothetical protein